MNYLRTLHETVIRDLIDLVHDFKDSDEISRLTNRKKSIRSIAHASQNLTLVFPVIVSTNISIDAASTIVKAIERKCVSMLQLLFAASQITQAKDGLEYLSNFHSNLKFDNSITVDGLVSALDKYVTQNESNMSFDMRRQYEILSEDVKNNLNYFFPESVSESGLENVYSVMGRNGRFLLESKDINDVIDLDGIYKDIVDKFKAPTDVQDSKISGKNNPKGGKTISSNNTNNSNNSNSNNSVKNTVNYTIKTADKLGGPSAKDVSDVLKNGTDFFQKQLVASDVKKVNELVPTTMIVNFISSDNGEVIPTQMLVGVKAKMYPVDSMDIINRVSVKHKDNNSLLKFIRSTTREISFIRDFLFAIDKAKIDALSNSKKGSSSPMWKILERRSKKSKLRRALGQVNDASAITTLVMSQDEIEYLKKNEGIDLEKPRAMEGIMNSYNFMGAVIVDETVETAKFLWDTGDDVYETLAFSSLERDTSDSNNKKMLNIMSKLSR